MQFYEKALAGYNRYLTDPKKKDYFAIAATLALLIVLVIMIYPAAIHVSKLNTEVSAGKEYLQSIRDKQTNLETAQANFEQVKNDLALIDSALPIGANIKTYLKSPLEILATKHGLTIKSLQVSNVPISDPVSEEGLVLNRFEYFATFEGTFTAFKNFLGEIENFIRLTEVEGFEIKSVPNSPIRTITVKASAHYLGTPINLIPNEVPNAQ